MQSCKLLEPPIIMSSNRRTDLRLAAWQALALETAAAPMGNAQATALSAELDARFASLMASLRLEPSGSSSRQSDEDGPEKEEDNKHEERRKGKATGAVSSRRPRPGPPATSSERDSLSNLAQSNLKTSNSNPQTLNPRNSNPRNSNPRNSNPRNSNPQNSNPRNSNPQNSNLRSSNSKPQTRNSKHAAHSGLATSNLANSSSPSNPVPATPSSECREEDPRRGRLRLYSEPGSKAAPQRLRSNRRLVIE